MDALGRLVDWCRREGESLQMQREMLKSGKFRIFKDEGSGQVDASLEIIERITANITELVRWSRLSAQKPYGALGARRLPREHGPVIHRTRFATNVGVD